LHGGADPRTLKPIAALVVEADRRLEQVNDERLDADEATVGRRQAVAATRTPQRYSGG
jgi:hypothetical protein